MYPPLHFVSKTGDGIESGFLIVTELLPVGLLQRDNL
jgi:hypothetical protein